MVDDGENRSFDHLLLDNNFLCVGNVEVAHLLADAGQLRHGVVTVLGSVVILAALDECAGQVCVVLFVDGEVGDGCFHLQSGCGCDGAAAYTLSLQIGKRL